jgi:hypothetical protein
MARCNNPQKKQNFSLDHPFNNSTPTTLWFRQGGGYARAANSSFFEKILFQGEMAASLVFTQSVKTTHTQNLEAQPLFVSPVSNSLNPWESLEILFFWLASTHHRRWRPRDSIKHHGPLKKKTDLNERKTPPPTKKKKTTQTWRHTNWETTQHTHNPKKMQFTRRTQKKKKRNVLLPF